MKMYAIRNKKTGEYYMEPDHIIPDKDEVFAATTEEWAVFIRMLYDMKDTHEIVTFREEPTEPCERCGVDDFAKNEGIVQLGFLSNKKVIFAVGDDDYVNVVDGFKDTIEELIQTFDVTVGKLLHTRDTLYNLRDDIEAVKEFVENEQAKEG